MRMKQLKSITLNKTLARQKLDEFRALLDDPSKRELKEKEDNFPFFACHEQLIVLMGSYKTKVGIIDRIATEFDVFGDHTADAVVGDSKKHQYWFIEYEDATKTSIFKNKSKKATHEWSDRFDHGCSQIIDWHCSANDPTRQNRNQAFNTNFGEEELATD